MGISSRTRIKLAERADWRCGWCAQKTRRDMGWQNSATIEHVQPVSEGGTNLLTNLASACARCNRLRGTQPAEEFRCLAVQFEPDTRTLLQALAHERKIKRAHRQTELAARCDGTTFTYVVVPDHELNAKERLRKDRTLVRNALKHHKRNPFEVNTRRHRLFEAELAKLSPPDAIWLQAWNKLTAWCASAYSAITGGEKRRENCVR